ncbi:hypothetical protein J8N05_41600 [Streptomyces sp. BH-SS-21]|uniref:Uncharacterized protein n=1 Tax=Streptomyces liliiviolaceus TaxID=2823109 RepID=A0A940Y3J0_9ACTN|nr:hypothetical protein [Streptomyces liliiviolaceus]MBQ0854660.1 hypothetical protein [Streptomyces liliiviolaceus]
MADVLQATANGLGPEAAAVWAGVPGRVLQSWLKQDPAFACALEAAGALATAHGLGTGREATPAMLRVATVAFTRGADWSTAARAAGFKPYRLRQLLRASPALGALVHAARNARPRKPRNPPRASRRSVLAGRAANEYGYRLVRLDDPALPLPPVEKNGPAPGESEERSGG